MKGRLDLGAWLHAVEGGRSGSAPPIGPSLNRDRLVLLDGADLGAVEAPEEAVPQTSADARRYYARMMLKAAALAPKSAQVYRTYAASAKRDWADASVLAILSALVERTRAVPAVNDRARVMLDRATAEVNPPKKRSPVAQRKRRPVAEDVYEAPPVEQEVSKGWWEGLTLKEKAVAVVGTALIGGLLLLSPTQTAPRS